MGADTCLTCGNGPIAPDNTGAFCKACSFVHFGRNRFSGRYWSTTIHSWMHVTERAFDGKPLVCVRASHRIGADYYNHERFDEMLARGDLVRCKPNVEEDNPS